MIKNILFDLDGTLTDPKEGITRSVAYALEYYGIHVENTDNLINFIGPPLWESFKVFYGFDDEKADETVMVGDRKHDIHGAKLNNMRNVGVLFGYGSREEFEAAGADYVVETVNELYNYLSTIND